MFSEIETYCMLKKFNATRRPSYKGPNSRALSIAFLDVYSPEWPIDNIVDMSKVEKQQCFIDIDSNATSYLGV